ncbi:ABC transporter permease, partial [Acidobacteriota bacterium]
MFDLDSQIKKWKRGILRNGAVEDGYIMELESHLRDEIDLLIGRGDSEERAFKTAVEKIGDADALGAEYYKSDTRRMSARPPWEFKNFFPALLWNTIKVTFRKIKRQKGYSLINIAGLTVGLTCCLFILLFVQFHLSFDNFHENIDRIFVVGQSSRSEAGTNLNLGSMAPTAPTLKEKYSQVEYSARINRGWIIQVSSRDRVFKEQGLWHASPDIFRILSIPFKKGNPSDALVRPNTAVLTETMSQKYFGEADPIGEILKIGDEDIEITGLLFDPPKNMENPFQIIMSWETIADEEHWQGWEPGMTATLSLIKLKPDVDPFKFEQSIKKLPHEYVDEELVKMGLEMRFFLFPFRDIHLHLPSGDKIAPSPHLKNVYIFSVVGFLILLIACMNFMNLATARSSHRSTEVGLRKVVG